MDPARLDIEQARHDGRVEAADGEEPVHAGGVLANEPQ
jgi:hypothetical protein